MKNVVAAVYEFNHKVLGLEPRELAPMTDAEAQKLNKQLDEERFEFQEGHDKQDIIKCVDSLLDGIYFAIGGLYRMGLTPDQVEACMLAIHEANMEKKLGKVDRRHVEGAVDAVKPEGWKPPEERLGEILFETR